MQSGIVNAAVEVCASRKATHPAAVCWPAVHRRPSAASLRSVRFVFASIEKLGLATSGGWSVLVSRLLTGKYATLKEQDRRFRCRNSAYTVDARFRVVDRKVRGRVRERRQDKEIGAQRLFRAVAHRTQSRLIRPAFSLIPSHATAWSRVFGDVVCMTSPKSNIRN